MSQKPLVAIVGRPNVGKSTLFNRLIGERRAIVEDIPGTTRDRLYGEVEWNGRIFSLVDTGGLELDRPDSMMALVAAQVQVALQAADVILLAVDAVEGLTAADEEIAQLLRRGDYLADRKLAGKRLKPVIVVAGKAETPGRRDAANEFYGLGFDTVFAVSALHGTNSGDLMDEIVNRLPDSDPEEEEEDDRLKVAIVGRPNVGKSQLLNKLLGEERVVVSNVPGTTRDAIDTEIEHEGRKFLLIDTAGIRRRGKVEQGIEKYAVLRSRRAIERADVAALVVDATDLLTAQDLHIAGDIETEGKGAILVINKWDLVEKDTYTTQEYLKEVKRELNFAPWVPAVFISALTGQRIQKVLDEAMAVEAERNKRIATNRLNEVVLGAVEAHPPTSHKGRLLKILYATQVAVAPPSFVFFVNDPDLVHFAYQRFLENTIRDAFGFRGTTIRLWFRKRTGEERGAPPR